MTYQTEIPESSASPRGKDGFTLVEVVVSCALLGLLVVASFIAVTSVAHSAHLMAQRVTAQGMCTALLENMKLVRFDRLSKGEDQDDTDDNNDDSDYWEGHASQDGDYSDDKDVVGILAHDIVARGLGPGSRNVTISYEVRNGDGAPNRKDIRITCSWEFTDRVWYKSQARGTHTEVLEAVITDRYSTYAEKLVLNVSGFKLNPNCNLSTDHKSYTLPAKLRIVDTDGRVWTQKDLQSGGLSGISARSVEIFPGGGGEQTGLYSGYPDLTVKNSKTYAYYSKDDSKPISVSISSKDRNGVYTMSMICADATVNIE